MENTPKEPVKNPSPLISYCGACSFKLTYEEHQRAHLNSMLEVLRQTHYEWTCECGSKRSWYMKKCPACSK